MGPSGLRSLKAHRTPTNPKTTSTNKQQNKYFKRAYEGMALGLERKTTHTYVLDVPTPLMLLIRSSQQRTKTLAPRRMWIGVIHARVLSRHVLDMHVHTKYMCICVRICERPACVCVLLSIFASKTKTQCNQLRAVRGATKWAHLACGA